MKLSDIKGKPVAIKCTTKDEMSKVVDILHKDAAWAYRGSFYRLDAYENGYIYIFINSSGAYTNYKGENLNGVDIKILAKAFLDNNQPKREGVHEL